jgi:hypothetical protein
VAADLHALPIDGNRYRMSGALFTTDCAAPMLVAAVCHLKLDSQLDAVLSKLRQCKLALTIATTLKHVWP